MADIKTIAGFDESSQRLIHSGSIDMSQAELAAKHNTSRGTIIRILKQIGPIIDEECELAIIEAEMEANDDSIPREIKRTPFIILLFG